jgi:hypothetical protein
LLPVAARMITSRLNRTGDRHPQPKRSRILAIVMERESLEAQFLGQSRWWLTGKPCTACSTELPSRSSPLTRSSPTPLEATSNGSILGLATVHRELITSFTLPSSCRAPRNARTALS